PTRFPAAGHLVPAPASLAGRRSTSAARSLVESGAGVVACWDTGRRHGGGVLLGSNLASPGGGEDRNTPCHARIDSGRHSGGRCRRQNRKLQQAISRSLENSR